MRATGYTQSTRETGQRPKSESGLPNIAIHIRAIEYTQSTRATGQRPEGAYPDKTTPGQYVPLGYRNIYSR